MHDKMTKRQNKMKKKCNKFNDKTYFIYLKYFRTFFFSLCCVLFILTLLMSHNCVQIRMNKAIRTEEKENQMKNNDFCH